MIRTSEAAIVLSIDDSSRTGEARRAALAVARRLGFDETESGKLAIIVTEAASNLSKHGKEGEIVIQGIEAGAAVGVEILTIDRGPGMLDLGRCRADGYSTAGSPGTGLGALARLSSSFDIHSLPGIGTTVLARLWSPRPPASGLDFGAVNIPLRGEDVCGDSWAIRESFGRTLLVMVDGLGHGPQAAEAARAAIATFAVKDAEFAPAEMLQAAHLALRSTRGAAMAVARIDHQDGQVVYAGIGNIASVILGPAEGNGVSMVSQNGTVGHTLRKVQEFRYPWMPGSLLVMHSDGLTSHWQLGRYAGLRSSHSGLIAATLFRDYKRGRDDVTVLAVREGMVGPR